MRNLLLIAVTFTAVPSLCEAQSDLRKIGNFLQDAQQFQQRQQGQRQPPPQNKSGGVAPYKIDPNSSGNQNRGSFDGNNFFTPQNGTHNHQHRFPQQTYPQQQIYQGNNIQAYPNQNIVYPSQSQLTPVARVYSNQPIVIRCDSTVVGTCQYELLTARNSSFPYSISGGQSQRLTENTDWAFRYRPSLTAAFKTYRLRGGKTYEMRKSGNQWQFYMLP